MFGVCGVCGLIGFELLVEEAGVGGTMIIGLIAGLLTAELETGEVITIDAVELFAVTFARVAANPPLSAIRVFSPDRTPVLDMGISSPLAASNLDPRFPLENRKSPGGCGFRSM
jgi:hypothetical protein